VPAAYYVLVICHFIQRLMERFPISFRSIIIDLPTSNP